MKRKSLNLSLNSGQEPVPDVNLKKTKMMFQSYMPHQRVTAQIMADDT